MPLVLADIILLLFLPPTKNRFMEEKSFGIIPVQKAKGKWQVFLIKSRRSGHWGFPKGKPNPGETPADSAIRELKEETGLALERFLTKEPLLEQYEYFFKGKSIAKTVYYFPAIVHGRIRLQSKEVVEGNWFPIQEAVAKITYPGTRQLCEMLYKILAHVN